MITLITLVLIAGIILLAVKLNSTGPNQLTTSNKIHLIVLSIINLITIGKMISFAWAGNDKAVVLVIFGYPTLMILNGLVWLTLVILKRPEYLIYKISTLGLVLLFIPTLVISSLY